MIFFLGFVFYFIIDHTPEDMAATSYQGTVQVQVGLFSPAHDAPCLSKQNSPFAPWRLCVKLFNRQAVPRLYEMGRAV